MPPPGWRIRFEDVEYELSQINRRAANRRYKLLKPKPGRFHDGQYDRYLPSSPMTSSPMKSRPSTAPVIEISDLKSTTSRSSIRRRTSRHASRQSSTHSDTMRRALQSIQKVPEALKHLRAFAPTQNASFEDRLAEFHSGSEMMKADDEQGAAPEDLFRDLFGPAKPQSVSGAAAAASSAASAPVQQSASSSAAAGPNAPRSKPSQRLEASLEVFVEHGLLPRPASYSERYRRGFSSYNMRSMDATQRDLYAFATQLDRLHKSQAKNIGRERAAAYRRCRKYHRELLERSAEDAKIKTKSRSRP